MIDSIDGILIKLTPSHAIINVNGFGIRVHITTNHINSLEKKIGGKVFILTKMILRDDSIMLFGFESEFDLNIFNKLNTVSGIGPKTAINMINKLGSQNIIEAISSQNTSIISSAPGVGNKTAKRILIELEKYFEYENDIFTQEAINAIQNMGHSQQEAKSMVEKARSQIGKNYTTLDLIKEALKVLI